MLTLTQLYNLGTAQNIDIFDGLTLPEDSAMDRDTLVNTIIMQCGLNIPMYADPYVMRSAINIWSAKNQYTFKHIDKIYSAEYSPIENTDRYDSVTVQRDRSLDDDTQLTNRKVEDLDTSSSTTTGNTNTHTGSDTNTTEETTSAFNSSTYEPDTKAVSETAFGSTITDSGSSSTTGSTDKTTNITGSNSKDVTEEETTTTTQHLHGNIGTTTNTLLQTEEYNLLKDFNPYTFISGLFENELTLCVY